MLENHEAMHLQWSITVLPAAFLVKYASNKIVIMSQNQGQASVNDCCAAILDNLTGMEHR